MIRVPPNVKYQELFLKLQREAREAKRGLWKREKGGGAGFVGCWLDQHQLRNETRVRVSLVEAPEPQLAGDLLRLHEFR